MTRSCRSRAIRSRSSKHGQLLGVRPPGRELERERGLNGEGRDHLGRPRRLNGPPPDRRPTVSTPAHVAGRAQREQAPPGPSAPWGAGRPPRSARRGEVVDGQRPPRRRAPGQTATCPPGPPGRWRRRRRRPSAYSSVSRRPSSCGSASVTRSRRTASRAWRVRVAEHRDGAVAGQQRDGQLAAGPQPVPAAAWPRRRAGRSRPRRRPPRQARSSTASSSSVNSPPPRFSVRYRLPKTRSRTRTGTPRKVRIAGWPVGEPRRLRVRRDVWRAAASAGP